MINKKSLSTKLSPTKKSSNLKLIPWKRAFGTSALALHKKSQAGILVDEKGAPRFFIFDAFALLDILSEIDEQLVDHLSGAGYHSKTINPAGWLIDEIESQLPLNSAYIQSLKSAIREAQEKGWIPFETIVSALSLSAK